MVTTEPVKGWSPPLDPLPYIHAACGQRVTVVNDKAGDWDRAKHLMKEHVKQCK